MTKELASRFSHGAFGEQSWEHAIAFADSLGAAPSSIQLLVRSPLGHEDASTEEPGRDSSLFLIRFLKSAAFRAPYFQAISLFRSEMIGPPDEPFLEQDFIDSFSCLEHAFISALMFMHRTVIRGADVACMEQVTKRLQRTLNLGWFIGDALKPVGPGVGMLVGGIQWLGLLPIARHDSEGLHSYIEHLDTSTAAWTVPELETKLWGCSSVQVGLIMLQRFGFSAVRLVPLMRALTSNGLRLPTDPFERSCYAADAWIRNMVDPNSHPSIPLPPAFYLAQDRIDEIQRRVFAASKRGVSNWLTAAPDSMTPDSAPQLFCNQDGDILRIDGEIVQLDELKDLEL